MKINKKNVLYVFISTAIFSPLVSFGAPLVSCTSNCGFNDLIITINNVIKFALFQVAIPFSAVMFAWAGILFIFAGGDTSQISKAKGIFFNVVVGLAIALGAFLIVETFLIILGYEAPPWTGF